MTSHDPKDPPKELNSVATMPFESTETWHLTVPTRLDMLERDIRTLGTRLTEWQAGETCRDFVHSDQGQDALFTKLGAVFSFHPRHDGVRPGLLENVTDLGRKDRFADIGN